MTAGKSKLRISLRAMFFAITMACVLFTLKPSVGTPERVIDCGTIGLDQPCRFNLVIRNTGLLPLYARCTDCTMRGDVADSTRQWIMPGKQISIPAWLEIRKPSKIEDAWFGFETNDPLNRRLVFTVRCDVREQYSPEPH